MVFLILFGGVLWVAAAVGFERSVHSQRVLRRRNLWRHGDLGLVIVMAICPPMSFLGVFFVSIVQGATTQRGNAGTPGLLPLPNRADPSPPISSARPGANHLGDLLDMALWTGLGLYGFFVGLVIMAVELSYWRLFGWVLGPAFIGGACWLFQFYRRRYIAWRNLRHQSPPDPAGFNHGVEILAYLTGVLTLAVIGAYITVAAL